MLNPKKVNEFKKYAREEYAEGLITDKVANVRFVDKTDESFIQVGIRPIIEDDFLTMDNFDSRLPGVGRHVAIGEEDFLIRNTLDKIKKEEIETAIEFPNYINSDDSVILLSTKFYVEVFTKLMHRIDYEAGERLDRKYPIISIPEKILGNRIIILDKKAISWEKEVFEDKETGKKEILDISIKPVSFDKVDITLRSVNKIQIIDKDLIRVLEVKYGTKG